MNIKICLKEISSHARTPMSFFLNATLINENRLRFGCLSEFRAAARFGSMQFAKGLPLSRLKIDIAFRSSFWDDNFSQCKFNSTSLPKIK